MRSQPELPPPIPAAGPPSPLGRWAAGPEACARNAWIITQGGLTTAAGEICALSDVRPNATGWTAMATCPIAEDGVLELNTTGAEDQTLVVSGRPFAQPITLVRCTAGAGDPHQPIDAALAIDQQIAAGGAAVKVTTFEDNALISHIGRVDGEIVKIVEPIVGTGPLHGDRSFYYRPGETTPFLIREPEGAYAFADGRLEAIFSPESEIRPEMRVADRQELNRRLLMQAETLYSAATKGPGLQAAE